MATTHSVPGFGNSLYLSPAMYYSPGQWCSVGCDIHNLRLPNFKHLWGHCTPIISAWHIVTDSVLRPSIKLFSGMNFQIVHNCDRKCRLIVFFSSSNIGHYDINNNDYGMFLYYWHTWAVRLWNRCVSVLNCSFNRRDI